MTDIEMTAEEREATIWAIIQGLKNLGLVDEPRPKVNISSLIKPASTEIEKINIDP